VAGINARLEIEPLCRHHDERTRVATVQAHRQHRTWRPENREMSSELAGQVLAALAGVATCLPDGSSHALARATGSPHRPGTTQRALMELKLAEIRKS
jgi:hypothetical protein